MENREKFREKYQAGKQALERGRYRLSVENLEAAQELVAPASRLEGEVKIWLVTAYQAADNISEAVALCQELVNHPDLETRQQAKRLLYILQAPKLSRPKEWMSEIPDLATTSDGKAKYVTAKTKTNINSSQSNNNPEPVDLSQVNTEDNQFIWVAIIFILLTFGGLFWLN